jgi:hypothetical protein
MWLSHLISPASFDRREAMQAVNEYLSCVFPKHFSG